METARHIIAALTHCGTLDADAFIDLVEQYDLDVFVLVEELDDMCIQRIGLNDLMYVAHKTIIEYFLKYVAHAKRVRHFTNAEYQVFINYLDSSAWFEDDNLQRWFEQWQYTRKKALTF